jgi:outer membrane receptor protein involved in Fe transport
MTRVSKTHPVAGEEDTVTYLNIVLAGSSLLALAGACPANAQSLAQSTGPAQDVSGAAAVPASEAVGEAPQAEGEDIVVTGSRIANLGSVAPTPVTAVSADTLLASQPSTIAAGLNNLPALTQQGGPAVNSGTTGGGQNFLNLRGLGQTRTLVLLDGKRFVSSTADSRVDTNLLPTGLISRVDVVTGGASAAYGSDAVTGVVNFVLDRRFTGVKADVSTGISQRGDNVEYRGVVTAGTAFDSGRGHIVGSVEYFENQGVEGDARDFRRAGDAFVTIAGTTPVRQRASQVRTTATYGGLIVTGNGGTAAANASFQGIQFGPGGSLLPYDYGSLVVGRGTATGQQSGGDGVNTVVLQQIVRPLTRGTAFVGADYDLTDRLNVYAQGSYGYTRTVYDALTTANIGSFAFTIRNDNAFLPAELRSRMAAAGVTSLTMTRFAGERGAAVSDNRNETLRGLIGADWKFGGLTLSGYYTHGTNLNVNPLYNNQITANIARAVDAVVDPATQQIVCRSTLSNPSNGCVPYNPFGAGSPSAASLDYVNGTSLYRARNTQDVASLSLSGQLAELWAGPLSFAIGGEYRDESVVVTTNALSAAGAFRLANSSPYRGSYNIKEAFAEIDLPLLRDTVFARALSVNAAVRHADYSTVGGATTWKVGGSW